MVGGLPEEQPDSHREAGGPWREALTSSCAGLLKPGAAPLASKMVPSMFPVSAAVQEALVGEGPELLRLLGLSPLPLWDSVFESKQFFLLLISHIKLLIVGEGRA